jgi:hypothetical protein
VLRLTFRVLGAHPAMGGVGVRLTRLTRLTRVMRLTWAMRLTWLMWLTWPMRKAHPALSCAWGAGLPCALRCRCGERVDARQPARHERADQW